MQIRNGCKSSLRMMGRTLLTALLLTLITALLGTSLGAADSVRRTLSSLSGRYVTIARADLSPGADTPSPEELSSAREGIAACALPSWAAWQPEALAQCRLPDAFGTPSVKSSSQYAVLRVRVMEPGVFSGRGTLPGAVEEALFSTRDVAGKNVEILSETLEPGRRYLVYGRWFPGELGATASLELLEPPVELAEGETGAPGAQALFDLAEQLDARSRSVTAAVTADPETYFPFQQELVSLAEGRLFTKQELAGDVRVCLLPQKLAREAGVSAGQIVRLHLAAAKNAPVLESYVPAEGYALEDDFLVVGLLRAKDAWETTVILPPQTSLAGASGGDGALGQFLLENDRAEDFLLWAQEQLPAGVRVTLYDQGYSETARPIRLMLRAMRLAAAVCTLAGVCFLVLTVWLFVQRQRKTGGLMHRMGVPGGAITVYFLSAWLPAALPAAALGAYLSWRAAGIIAARLAAQVLSEGSADLRYSSAHLSLQKSVQVVSVPTPARVYMLLAAAVLAASCALCACFAAKTAAEAGPRRARAALRTRTRTRMLRGGAVKYAWLSAGRGGFRTAVSFAAPLAAAILFSSLNLASARTAQQLRTLEEESTVRGYYTSVDGRLAEGMLLYFTNVYSVAELPQTLRVTVTGSQTGFFFIGKLTGEGRLAEGFRLPEVPHGEHQTSRLSDYYAETLPVLVEANAVEDVPRLMFRGDPGLTWAEGFGPESLEGWRAGKAPDCSDTFYWEPDEPVALDGALSRWELDQRRTAEHVMIGAMQLKESLPCVMPAALMEEYGLEPGDEFVATTGVSQNGLSMVRLQAAGSYTRSGGRPAAYIPLYTPASTGEQLEQDLQSYGRRLSSRFTIRTNVWASKLRASSAVFRFRCSDLDALRARLKELGLSEVGQMSGARMPFVLEDQTYLAAKHSVEQRLWYMERIFPAVTVLAELLALVLSVLQVLSRRREIRLMHCMGAGRAQTILSVWCEQAALALLGTAAGLLICARLSMAGADAQMQSAVFAALWLLGSLLAALGAVRQPMRAGKEG